MNPLSRVPFQGAEARVPSCARFRLELASVERGLVPREIVVGKVHDAPGGEPVAPGPPDLLVVLLDGLGSPEVKDLAHIGLVDAHAESNRCDNDHCMTGKEGLVRLVSLRDRAARVVEADAVFHGWQLVEGILKTHRDYLCLLLSRNIDDGAMGPQIPSFLCRLPDCLNQRRQGSRGAAPRLPRDGDGEIRPVEGLHALVHRLPIQRQDANHVFAHVGHRSSGERHERHVWEVLPNDAKLLVVGPEVVAPFAHAVRLVDRKERDALLRVERLQARHGGASTELLWAQIHNLERALKGLLFLGAVFLPASQEGGHLHHSFTDDLVELVHLIPHERNQGRHDDRDPAKMQRWQLVAQGLAASRGPEHRSVAAFRDRPDDGLLPGSEVLKAKARGQGPQQS
eukprot:scaffold2277_cov256-Pinguiococcus_pyrenoidosus.AAC.4